MKMLLNPNPLEARQPGSGVAPTQGARRATGVCVTAGDRRDLDISPPDPEVTEAKPRRRFTAAYKLRIIDQADQCGEPGQIGALPRREGLYSSHLTNWRKQREQGILRGLTPAKRGRKARPRNPLDTRALSFMRSGSILLNAARGGIVDEAALVESLKSGRLAGAGLDVFETEPLTAAAARKFSDLPNLLLTPHIAGVTIESNTRVSQVTIANVRSVLEGIL